MTKKFTNSGAIRRKKPSNSKTLQVPLDLRDWKTLHEVANEAGLSPPELVRAALRDKHVLPPLAQGEVA